MGRERNLLQHLTGGSGSVRRCWGLELHIKVVLPWPRRKESAAVVDSVRLWYVRVLPEIRRSTATVSHSTRPPQTSAPPRIRNTKERTSSERHVRQAGRHGRQRLTTAQGDDNDARSPIGALLLQQKMPANTN